MRPTKNNQVTAIFLFLLLATVFRSPYVTGKTRVNKTHDVQPATGAADQMGRSLRFPCVTLPHPREITIDPNRKCKGYLMVFVGHSGSSILEELITRHFNFTSWDYEPLETYRRDGTWNATAAAGRASEIFGNAQRRGIRTGFKIRVWSILKAPKLHRQLVEKYELCVISQYRLNTLLKTITSIREREMNQTQFTLMEDRSNPPDMEYRLSLPDQGSIRAVLIDTALGDTDVEKITSAAAILEPNGTLIIHCTYEEFVQQPQILMDRIAAGLGVDRKQVDLVNPRFRKASPPLVSQNVDEMTFQLLSSAVPDKMLWMLGEQSLCRTGT